MANLQRNITLMILNNANHKHHKTNSATHALNTRSCTVEWQVHRKKPKQSQVKRHFYYYYTCLTASFPVQPGKAMCKQNANNRSRQITTINTPQLNFHRPDALPDAQPTASRHWRHPQVKRQVLINLQWNKISPDSFSCGFTSHSTQNRSLRTCFPKPISWLGVEKTQHNKSMHSPTKMFYNMKCTKKNQSQV